MTEKMGNRPTPDKYTKPHIEVGDPKGTPLKNVRFIGLGSAN